MLQGPGRFVLGITSMYKVSLCIACNVGASGPTSRTFRMILHLPRARFCGYL